MTSKKPSDEIDPSTFTDEDWKEFRPAISSECTSMIDRNEALTPPIN